MALNFPDNPSLNDTYTSPSGVNFVWDGVKWRSSNDPTFDSLTVDTDTLYVDSTNDRVGVGRVDPQYPLDVAGEIRASSGVLFGADTAVTNTLDDYEEGTWTPVFTSSSPSNGSWAPNSVNGGSYTKVGRMVHVMFNYRGVWTNNSASGSIRLSGLPFANSTFSNPNIGGNSFYSGGSIPFPRGIDLPSGTYVSGALIYEGATSMGIYETTTTAEGEVNINRVSGADVNIHGTMCYYTDA